MKFDAIDELVTTRARAAQTEAQALREYVDATVARAVRDALKDVQAEVHSEADRLLTVHEAAQLLNVRERTIYDWVKQNKIPYRRACGAIRFMRSELLAWTSGEAISVKGLRAVR